MHYPNCIQYNPTEIYFFLKKKKMDSCSAAITTLYNNFNLKLRKLRSGFVLVDEIS